MSGPFSADACCSSTFGCPSEIMPRVYFRPTGFSALNSQMLRVATKVISEILFRRNQYIFQSARIVKMLCKEMRPAASALTSNLHVEGQVEKEAKSVNLQLLSVQSAPLSLSKSMSKIEFYWKLPNCSRSSSRSAHKAKNNSIGQKRTKSLAEATKHRSN